MGARRSEFLLFPFRLRRSSRPPAIVLCVPYHDSVIIFIEGIDRTGKTELATELGRILGEEKPTMVKHYGAPEADTAIREYVGPFIEYDGKVNYVLDRAHVGEAIWPAYFEREPRMTEPERQIIELFFRSVGAVGVLTQRDPEGVRQAFAEADPPEPLDAEQALQAQKEFNDEWSKVMCPTAVYDHGSDVRERSVESIVRTAHNAEARYLSELEKCRGDGFAIRRAVRACL